jgi:hypothetical protein
MICAGSSVSPPCTVCLVRCRWCRDRSLSARAAQLVRRGPCKKCSPAPRYRNGFCLSALRGGLRQPRGIPAVLLDRGQGGGTTWATARKTSCAVSRLACAGQTLISAGCSACSAGYMRMTACPPGSRWPRSLPAGAASGKRPPGARPLAGQTRHYPARTPPRRAHLAARVPARHRAGTGHDWPLRRIRTRPSRRDDGVVALVASKHPHARPHRTNGEIERSPLPVLQRAASRSHLLKDA